MRTIRPSIRPILALLVLAASACATTTFRSSWRNPEARPLRLKGAKVVAIFVSRNPTTRRIAEDALAREISARGSQGVPAYTILSDDEIKDQESARAKLDQLGYHGAIVMRVVGRETQYSYEPGFWQTRPYYRRFWGGYWRWGWAHVQEPGYLREDRIVSVETLVYSFTQDELVWAGVSNTVNPDEIDKFIAELATAVTKQLEKEGLFAQT